MKRALLLATAVAIGCGNDEAKPPPPVTSPITVLDPGAEPRRTLRYQIGAAMQARIHAELDVTIDAGGQGGVLPTMVLGLETRAEAVLPNHRMRMRTTIVDVSARERAGSLITAAALDAEAHHLRGISFTGELAPDGTLEALAVDLRGRTLPPNLSSQVDSLAKTFQQVAMPLPITPVGIGAHWQFKKPIEQTGMKLTATTDVNVVALDAQRFSYVMTTTLAGDDQAVTQAGATIKLTKIGGDGKATGVVDLTRMTMTGEQALAFHAEMAGEDQNARMGLTVITRLTDDSAALPPPPAAVVKSAEDLGSGDTGSDDNATLEDH
ncbi:MAG: hypothetical protein SFX73_01110 [Kofleriaceae bacterium]|nr:hypothetical protein [Kofleriaceae bacterium]